MISLVTTRILLLVCLGAILAAATAQAPQFDPDEDEVLTNAKLSMAMEKLTAGDVSEARELYLSVIEEGSGRSQGSWDPLQREAHYRLAFLEYGQKTPLPVVFQHLDQATLHDDEPTPHDRLYNSGAGRIYREQGMTSNAQFHLTKAVNMDYLDDNNSVQDHLSLISVSMAAGDADATYAATVRCVRRSLGECARGLQQVVNYGMGEAGVGDTVDACLRAMEDESAVRVAPWYYRMRGLYCTHMGEFERAVHYHHKSIEVKGACESLPQCYYARGMANIQAGHCSEAHADFLTVLLLMEGLVPGDRKATVENLVVNFHFSGEYARYSKVSNITDFVGVIGAKRANTLSPHYGREYLPTLYFEQQHAVVTKLHDVWHEGESEVIHDGKGSLFLLGENGDANILQMVRPIEDQLPVIEVAKGAILNPLAQNYYHWTVEALSRLVVLLDEVLSKDPDVKLIVGRKKQFIVELLGMLGVDLETQVIWYHQMDFRYHIQELYFVDFRFPQGLKDNVDVDARTRRPVPPEVPVVSRSKTIELEEEARQCVHGYFPPMQVLHELRNRLTEGMERTRETLPSTVLYVSRSNERLRSVNNENLLIDHLRAAFGRALVVHTGAEAMEEQRKMFFHAKLVVGLHGAGLSNLLFCQPNITVVEFPLKAPSFNFYSYLSLALGLNYWVVPEASVPYFRNLTITEDLAETITRVSRHALFGQDIGTVDVEGGTKGPSFPILPAIVALFVAFAIVSLLDSFLGFRGAAASKSTARAGKERTKDGGG